MPDYLFDRLDTAAIREKVVMPPPPPAAVTSFLGRLSLFHGVPFAYLVPDQRLLPEESLKVFLIDPRWIDALIGGALSIGRGGMTRLLLNKTQAGNFIGWIVAAARAARPPDRVMNSAINGGAPKAVPSYGFSGFLLRTRILEAWPGLEVRAFRSGGRERADALALVRLDRIAPDLLLGVVDGQLSDLEITQPPEGLHFKAATAPRRGADPKSRVIDVAGWEAGTAGSAALAKANMSLPLRFVFRVGG